MTRYRKARFHRPRTIALTVLALAFAAPQEPRWRILGPGGGGSMFHPTVSPHDPRTAVVACDMTGNYLTTDASANWRFFSLRDPVRHFAFDPADPRTLYATTGILYRTTDLGATWTTILPRPAAIKARTTGDDHASEKLHLSEAPGEEIAAFAIDPARPNSLYAAAGASIWESEDRGATWRQTADLAGPVSALWIDPQSPPGDRTLFAAGPDSIYTRREGKWSKGESPGTIASISAALPVFYAASHGKVFVSEGGVKWSAAGDLNSGAKATLVTAAAPGTAYVAFTGRQDGIAKTTDRARTWQTLAYNGRDAWLSTRFGPGWAGQPYGLGCAPSDPATCYATDSGRVMRTTDAGRTWLPVYSRRAPDGNWTTNGIDVTTSYGVHFDPANPRHLFISYTDIGLWASDNAGESWYSATTSGVPREWVNTTYWIEFDPQVRGRIWAVMSGVHDLPRPKMWRRRSPDTYNGGVLRSDDGGRTWRVQNNGMPQTAATHILRDAVGALYVTGFGRGVFKSTDGGEHWALKNYGISGSQPFAWRIVRDPKEALYLIVARRSDDGSSNNEGDGALYRSTDSAGHWTRLPLPEGVNGPNGLAIDPANPRRLYLAAWGRSTKDGAFGGGIWLSTDAGVTWRNTLSKDQHIYDVTVHPTNPAVLYATGFEANLWRSTDRGLTWSRIPGFDFKWGHRAILDPREPGHLYVTTFGGSVWSIRVQ